MPEPLNDWLGWAGITLALLAFVFVVNRALDWIERRRSR